MAQSVLDTGTGKTFSFSLENLAADAAFSVELLDKDHGFAYEAWTKMGSPKPPTSQQVRELKELAMATGQSQIQADSKGVLTFGQQLSPWTVILIKQK